MKLGRKIRLLLFIPGLSAALILSGCGALSETAAFTAAETAASLPAETTAAARETAAETERRTEAAETLPALSSAAPTESEAETEAPTTDVPATSFVSETREYGARTVLINGSVFWVKDNRAIEPECLFNIQNMHPADFGASFSDNYPVVRESYLLCAGEAAETEVVHIHSENPGPAVYVVAGTHGDERAGWYAGLMLREVTVSCGDLYVLSIANVQGARAGRRYVTGSEDLNRSYPGSSDSQAGRLAAAIFSDIREKAPEIVLDLHEAIVVQSGRDFLGSTLIFTNLSVTEEFGDLFFDLRDATCDGEICFEPFGYNGPGPAGSLNNTVTTMLGIPVITVETFRGYPMEHRVEEHLEIAEYILLWKGMR